MIGPIFIKLAKELNAQNGFSEDIVIFVGKDTFTLLKKELVLMAVLHPTIGFEDIQEAVINTEFGVLRVRESL